MFWYIFIGISFAFVMTLLGGCLIFFFKNNISRKLSTIFYGLSAGIMLATTIWSLIIPSINYAENLGAFSFIPSIVGIALGGLFIAMLDLFTKKIESDVDKQQNKNFKLFLAVTLHNIPEGLATGFAFGVALLSKDISLCMTALIFAIGIGIQNFPEGTAVALPMKATLGSKKAFLYVFLSAIVEPISGVIGLFLAKSLSGILSYVLGFAAGAMLYVIVEEVLPEANLSGHNKLGTWCFIIGFCVMMILDVVFS